eukprot:TRINITY_DN13243_c0_g1_i1.p1 TRINITY_DN13243_c0_g1~~TRINITY_DN13243_c0_g1_i1.p1  ORF type:complete len:128 (-),score=9.38 TRINITY_DN13243_c0_g1_i1:128-463(-)
MEQLEDQNCAHSSIREICCSAVTVDVSGRTEEGSVSFTRGMSPETQLMRPPSTTPKRRRITSKCEDCKTIVVDVISLNCSTHPERVTNSCKRLKSDSQSELATQDTIQTPN